MALFENLPHIEHIKECYVDRSFEEACEEYKIAFQQPILDAIAFFHSTRKPAKVIIGNLMERFYGKDKKYKGDIIHLGFCIGRKRIWTHRNSETWKERGVKHPFQELQRELFNKGYYLQDRTKASWKNIYITISDKEEKDEKNEKNGTEEKLWHGLNVIPKRQNMVSYFMKYTSGFEANIKIAIGKITLENPVVNINTNFLNETFQFKEKIYKVGYFHSHYPNTESKKWLRDNKSTFKEIQAQWKESGYIIEDVSGDGSHVTVERHD